MTTSDDAEPPRNWYACEIAGSLLCGAIASLRLAKMNSSVCSVTGFLVMFPGDDRYGLAPASGTGMACERSHGGINYIEVVELDVIYLSSETKRRAR